MLKIFTPKLVAKECIPNKRWVYKNFWGSRKTIERFDVTTQPASSATDVNFVSAMRRVLVSLVSTSSKGNEKIENIIKHRKLIKVTTYRIDDEINPENSRIIGIIKTGNVTYRYFQSTQGGNDIPQIEKIEIPPQYIKKQQGTGE